MSPIDMNRFYGVVICTRITTVIDYICLFYLKSSLRCCIIGLRTTWSRELIGDLERKVWSRER